MNAFDEIHSLAPQQIWEGVVGRAVEGERVTLAVVELEPGAAVPEHSHENEQIGVLVQGSLRFTIGGETRELGPGGTWRILANVPHSVTVGDEPVVLVEVFAPARDDWHGLERQEPRACLWP